jgi:hypothetical protein
MSNPKSQYKDDYSLMTTIDGLDYQRCLHLAREARCADELAQSGDNQTSAMGFMAEVAFGRLIGQPADLTRHERRKDGADFILPNGLTVDVKCSASNSRWLIIDRHSERGNFTHKYDLYCCCHMLYDSGSVSATIALMGILPRTKLTQCELDNSRDGSKINYVVPLHMLWNMDHWLHPDPLKDREIIDTTDQLVQAAKRRSMPVDW